jgi:CBS-domain-containing membrane protein
LADISSAQIMSREVITTTPTEHLETALKKLVEHDLQSLVVVQQENGHRKPVGMLSATELSTVLA